MDNEHAFSDIPVDPIGFGPTASLGCASSTRAQPAARREKLPLRGTRRLPVSAFPLAPSRNPVIARIARPAKGGPGSKEVEMGNARTLEVMIVPVGGLPYRKVIEANRDGSFLNRLAQLQAPFFQRQDDSLSL